MPIPAECPECNAVDISVTSVPPSEHQYAGWQTKIECTNCGTEIFEPELD